MDALVSPMEPNWLVIGGPKMEVSAKFNCDCHSQFDKNWLLLLKDGYVIGRSTNSQVLGSLH
jgi:hypothetical protein